MVYLIPNIEEVSLYGVVAKVRDYSLEVSEFELQSRCNVSFLTFRKSIKPLYPPVLGV